MPHHVQLKLKPDGPWHRRSTVRGYENTTACGEPIVGAFAIRDYQLDDQLCKLCHSRHEIDTGELKRFERDSDGIDELFFNDDVTPTIPTAPPIENGNGKKP